MAAVARVTMSYPASSGLYVGFVAFPFTLLEAWAARRRLRMTTVSLAVLAWGVAFGGVGLAHFQAVYSQGVLSTSSLQGGVTAMSAEVTRLNSLPPGDEIGLANVQWDSLTASALAVAFVATSFGGFVARRALGVPIVGPGEVAPPFEATEDEAKLPIVGMSVVLYGITLLVATIVTSVFIALSDAGIICFSPLVGLMIAIYSVPACAALTCGRMCSARVEKFARARSRPAA